MATIRPKLKAKPCRKTEPISGMASPAKMPSL
jgi:hypothetical protein